MYYVENISCLIFVLFDEYENFLTPKISWITVYTTHVHIHTHVQGIGDSGQGAVNAMLFVFFTKRVRHKLLPCCYKDSLLDNTSLQTSSINAGNTTSVHKYLTVSEKSTGRYVNSYSSSDSD